MSGSSKKLGRQFYFINKVATNVLEIEPTGSTLYLGDYDYYVEKKKEQAELAAAKEASQKQVEQPTTNISDAKLSYQQSKERQKQERKLSRAQAEAESKVEQLDARKTEIETAMTAPENLADLGKLQQLQKELDQVTNDLATAEEAWEEASLALEEFLAE